MKRIFFVAIAATFLAASCQKTEVINPVGGPSMSFTTGMSKLTKAPNPNAVDAENKGQRNLEFQHFSVWAYVNPDDDFSTNKHNVSSDGIYDGMRNILVECKTPYVEEVKDDPATEGTDEARPEVPGVWKTNKEYYWPGNNKNLRFFAVSADPAWIRPTAAGATCPVVPDYTAPSLTINDFEVGGADVDDDAAKVVKKDANEDLMIADFVEQNQSKTDIELTFRHALAKVEFVFKTIASTDPNKPAPDVWVQSLEVAGMQYKGDLVANLSATDRTKWSLEWERETATAAFIDDYVGVATYPSDADADVIADPTAMKLEVEPKTFTTWLMMPQPITADSKVNITYVINKRKFTAIFQLNGDKNTTINAWEPNQHIKYTVVLAPNTISFIPSIEDWTPTIDVDPENGTMTQNPPVAYPTMEENVTLYISSYPLAVGAEVYTDVEMKNLAADKEYTLKDGRKLTVENGKIKTITPAPEQNS